MAEKFCDMFHMPIILNPWPDHSQRARYSPAVGVLREQNTTPPISIPLVIICNKSSASLNEVVVCQSEEVYQSCGTHTCLRGGWN